MLALYIHWSQFGLSEYERATWQNNLKQYSSLLLMAVVLLAAYGFYVLNQGSSSAAASFPVLEATEAAPTTGGGLKTVLKTVTSRLSQLFKHGRLE